MNESNFETAMNAVLWANAFVAHCTENPSIASDKDTMVGWFSNAIMRGYDEGKKKAESLVNDEQLTKLLESVERLTISRLNELRQKQTPMKLNTETKTFTASSADAKLLRYFRKYALEIIDGVSEIDSDEVMNWAYELTPNQLKSKIHSAIAEIVIEETK